MYIPKARGFTSLGYNSYNTLQCRITYYFYINIYRTKYCVLYAIETFINVYPQNT